MERDALAHAAADDVRARVLSSAVTRMTDATITKRLRVLHAELGACTLCEKMIGPVVHGPPVASRILLVGQAPGPREGSFGKPFAWTAGRTLFRWFEESIGCDEETFRARVYMAAVARCFPASRRAAAIAAPTRARSRIAAGSSSAKRGSYSRSWCSRSARSPSSRCSRRRRS